MAGYQFFNPLTGFQFLLPDESEQAAARERLISTQREARQAQEKAQDKRDKLLREDIASRERVGLAHANALGGRGASAMVPGLMKILQAREQNRMLQTQARAWVNKANETVKRLYEGVKDPGAWFDQTLIDLFDTLGVPQKGKDWAARRGKATPEDREAAIEEVFNHLSKERLSLSPKIRDMISSGDIKGSRGEPFSFTMGPDLEEDDDLRQLADAFEKMAGIRGGQGGAGSGGRAGEPTPGQPTPAPDAGGQGGAGKPGASKSGAPPTSAQVVTVTNKAGEPVAYLVYDQFGVPTQITKEMADRLKKKTDLSEKEKQVQRDVQNTYDASSYGPLINADPRYQVGNPPPGIRIPPGALAPDGTVITNTPAPILNPLVPTGGSQYGPITNTPAPILPAGMPMYSNEDLRALMETMRNVPITSQPFTPGYGALPAFDVNTTPLSPGPQMAPPNRYIQSGNAIRTRWAVTPGGPPPMDMIGSDGVPVWMRLPAIPGVTNLQSDVGPVPATPNFGANDYLNYLRQASGRDDRMGPPLPLVDAGAGAGPVPDWMQLPAIPGATNQGIPAMPNFGARDYINYLRKPTGKYDRMAPSPGNAQDPWSPGDVIYGPSTNYVPVPIGNNFPPDAIPGPSTRAPYFPGTAATPADVLSELFRSNYY